MRSPTKTPSKEPLSRGDQLGLGGILIGIASYMLDGWIVKSSLLLVAVCLIAYWARRHTAHPFIRVVVAMVVIGFFVAGSSRQILEDSHGKNPSISLPHSLLAWVPGWARPEEPRTTSLPFPDLPLQSTEGKMFFRCLGDSSIPSRTLEQVKEDLSERIAAANDTFGISIEVSEINGGRKLTVKPNTPEGQMHMRGVKQFTLEIRKSGTIEKVGPEFLITYTIELPEPLGSLSRLMPIDPKSDQIALSDKYVEDMLGLPGGKCRMI
jgi:hypothetical protein